VDEELFKRVITCHPLLTEADARAANAWWLVNRRPTESIVEFLVRQQIFTPDCSKTVEMMRRGMITYCDPKRIFTEEGHRRLREYTVRAGFMERPAVAPGSAFQAAAKPPPPLTAESSLDDVKAWLARQAQTRSSSTNVTEQKQVHPTNPTSAQPLSAQGSSANLRSPHPRSSGVITRPPSDPSLPPRPPEVGDKLGKFLLTEEIGRGGSAIVFRAMNTTLNSAVAIKVLKFDREEAAIGNDDEASYYSQLKKEAQILAKFNHPNIVRVFDFEEDAAYPFLVLEYVDGLSLSEMLIHCGRLRCDRAVKLVFHVAEGLAAAQKKIGLVHRDVKPGNILLTRDGGIKLADLGLALTDTWVIAKKPSVTDTNILAGTVAYMSPEQATASETVDHRSDIYSLGATFYHALTGQMPFKGRSRMELIFKHAKEDVAAPHILVPGLDPAISDIVLKMLAKNPADRYQTYDELLSLLSLQLSKSEATIAVPSTHASAVATMPHS
jgi:tRNA A-37 threonylcarbamoyl transferase component Bud32